MRTYRTRPGDMLDAICHKYYGARSGAPEEVLQANPGLCRRGPVLPEGLLIELPDLAPAQAPGQVSLWD